MGIVINAVALHIPCATITALRTRSAVEVRRIHTSGTFGFIDIRAIAVEDDATTGLRVPEV